LRLIQPSEGTEDRPEKRAEGRTKDQPEKQTQGQSKHCGSVVQAIVFQPNDPQRLMIAVGCRVYEYKMDAGARSELQCLSFDGPEMPEISRLAFSHDAGKIAIAESPEGKVQIYDRRGGRSDEAQGTGCRKAEAAQVVTLGRHEGPALDLRFSPDDAEVVSSGIDRKIRVWRVDPASRDNDLQTGGKDFWSHAEKHLPEGGEPLGTLDKCLLREDEWSCAVDEQKD